MRKDVESFDDFCQYYTGRYVKGRDPSLLYRVVGKERDVEERSRRPQVAIFELFTHGRKTPERVAMHWDQIPDTILFGLPRIGTLAYKNELVYLYYTADRNGGRGYDSSRVSYHSFNSWLLTKRGLDVLQQFTLGEPHFAYLAVRNNHTSWHDAVDDLLDTSPKQPCYALSYNFGVYLGSGEHPTLTYKTRIIGSVPELNLVKLEPNFAEYADIVRNTLNREMRFTS